MKTLHTLVAIAALVCASAISLSAHAQSAADDMTEGEVRKVDKDTKKITIKHGEIKNLDMPGMTMLFQVRDPALLDMVKAGDKIKFRAEKTEAGIAVTEIQPAK